MSSHQVGKAPDCFVVDDDDDDDVVFFFLFLFVCLFSFLFFYFSSSVLNLNSKPHYFISHVIILPHSVLMFLLHYSDN